MALKFYLDTSIWMDLYEDRKGYSGECLGDFAWKLVSLIKAQRNKLVISDLLIRELESNYSIPEINGMIKLFENILEKIITNKKQRDEAANIAKERKLPPGDALHAILCRDYGLILITRDNDFRKLVDICPYHKPEEII